MPTSSRIAAVLAVAGVLTQMGYPVTNNGTRDALVVLGVVLFAGACVAHAVGSRGAAWTVGMVVLTAGGGLVVELLGTSTGFPFGDYTYAVGRLGPNLAGVPLLIGPAWTMGAYPAWCVAATVGGATNRCLTVVLTACGLAGWDLYLDPQMVADRRWTWAHPQPALPGVAAVPLTNYLGWLLVALVMAVGLAALQRLSHGSSRGLSHGPGTVSEALPHALFCWTWLGSALAHAAFLDLPASTGYGFVGMGLVGVPLVRRLHRLRRHRQQGRYPRSVLQPPGTRRRLVSTRQQRSRLAR